MISLKKIMQEKHNKGEKGDTRILNFENSSNFLSGISKKISLIKFIKEKKRISSKVDFQAFTLVELVIVVAILAILGTISFIYVLNYASSARDTKRASDVKSLESKIIAENARGAQMSELVVSENIEDLLYEGNTETGVLIGDEIKPRTIGISNFETLKENQESFQDPSYTDEFKDYKIAYSVGSYDDGGIQKPYNFYQLAYVEEATGKTKCIGNYYKIYQDDALSLFDGTIWQCGNSIKKDECPEGDKSGNAYDGSCVLMPINGVCGTANGEKDLMTTPSGSELCTKGNPAQVLKVKDGAKRIGWSWKCEGINGGSDVSCEGEGIETYLDPVTGLKWEKELTTTTYKWAENATYGEPIWNNGTYTYPDDRTSSDYLAFEYCSNLFSGRRVPTKNELATLIDYSRTTVSGKYYKNPGMSDTSYLTSTTYAPSTGSSRSINFSTALIGATSKATAMRVVCVSDSNGNPAQYITAVHGKCGTTHGQRDVMTKPTSGLCNLGTASEVQELDSKWSWSCLGSNGGATTNCGAYKMADGWVDPITGLIWEETPTNTTTYSWTINTSYETPTWNNGSYTYPEDRIGSDYPAFLHCSNLGTGRRLPTKNELATLVNYKKVAVETTYSRNPGMGAYNYLASTTYAPSTTNSRSVNFSTALIGATLKTTNAYVICVNDSSGNPAKNITAVHGKCGTTHGQRDVMTKPSSGLCSLGTASEVQELDTKRSWTCEGSNGGGTMSCGAYKIADGWIDPITGLIWEETPITTTTYSWAINTSYEAPTWNNGGYTYPEDRIGEHYPAFLRCSNLGGGRRLPTKNELATLVDYSRTTVSGKYYKNPGMVNATYLASTLYNNTNPRSVDFSTALINGLSNKTTTAYVICVNDSNGGITAVHGKCGETHGKRDINSKPTSGLCNIGTASEVQEPDNKRSWSCEGSNGGATMNCGAYKTVAVWEDPVTLLKWEDVPTTTTVYNWSVNTSYEAPTWSGTSYTYPNGRIGGDYPAFLHCSGLGTGRRLPTRNELATLVDYSRTTVSGKYYRNIGMVDGTYLASTLYNNTNPRSVNFSTALINGLTNKTTTAYVICIKD